MGLSRIPSFSDRPGFPSGLRVSSGPGAHFSRLFRNRVNMALFLQVLVIDLHQEALEKTTAQLQECSYEGASLLPLPDWWCSPSPSPLFKCLTAIIYCCSVGVHLLFGRYRSGRRCRRGV
jgi:hypothetical protein